MNDYFMNISGRTIPRFRYRWGKKCCVSFFCLLILNHTLCCFQAGFGLNDSTIVYMLSIKYGHFPSICDLSQCIYYLFICLLLMFRVLWLSIAFNSNSPYTQFIALTLRLREMPENSANHLPSLPLPKG